MWANDISVKELQDILQNYDYIWFSELDDAFVAKYSEVFENPSLVIDDEIYKISTKGEKVILEEP